MINKKRYAMAVIFGFVGSISVLMFQNMDVTNSQVQFDIMAIPKSGIAQVEVHTLTGFSNYQKMPVNIKTPIGPASWQMSAQDMAGNGSRDLVGVLTGQTGSGYVEVHSVSEASMYQTFDWHLATGKPANQVMPNSQFEFVDWGGHGGKPDLAYILKSGSGTHRVELHVYSAASNYKNLMWESTTAFGDAAPNIVFRFVDWGHHGGIPDLVGIFPTNTGTNRVEIHGASASSKFQSMSWNYSSGLGTDPNGDFRFFMRGHTDSSNPDLVAIRTKNSGSGKTEVHILNGSTAFMSFELQVATGMGQVGSDWDFSLMTSQSSALRTVANLDSSVAMNWLTKSVCVDGNNHPIQADPYPACPLGTNIRKIAVSENLPYFNFDGVNSEWDNFPMASSDYGGRQLVMNARQTIYNGGFDHQFRSEDQFDITVINPSGYVAGASTHDGGGYNTTFFGPNCQDYDGWVDFPAKNFLSNNFMNLAIQGSYWQQSGGNYSTTCSGSVSPGAEYQSWAYLPSYQFRTGKSMAAIEAAHGYEKNAWDPVNHPWHIETFFFTREYGVTRWEVWYPIEALNTTIKMGASNIRLTRGGQCGSVPDLVYTPGNGLAAHTYFVQDCRDASSVEFQSPILPIYPVPNTNLISNANFDSSASWNRGGSTISENIKTSTVARDVAFNSHGVNYLQTQCGSSATCSGQFIYQDIPISKFKAGNYAYGVSARIEGGRTQGLLTVGIQQLGPSGILWQDSFIAGANGIPAVAYDQGTYVDSESDSSPVLSAGFFKKQVANMPIANGATTLRIVIYPHGDDVFDISQVWIGAW